MIWIILRAIYARKNFIYDNMHIFFLLNIIMELNLEIAVVIYLILVSMGLR